MAIWCDGMYCQVHLVTSVPGRFPMPLSSSLSQPDLEEYMTSSGTKRHAVPCLDCAHHKDRICRRPLASSHSAGTVGGRVRGRRGGHSTPAEYGAQRIKSLLTKLSKHLPRYLSLRVSARCQWMECGLMLCAES